MISRDSYSDEVFILKLKSIFVELKNLFKNDNEKNDNGKENSDFALEFGSKRCTERSAHRVANSAHCPANHIVTDGKNLYSLVRADGKCNYIKLRSRDIKELFKINL